MDEKQFLRVILPPALLIAYILIMIPLGLVFTRASMEVVDAVTEKYAKEYDLKEKDIYELPFDMDEDFKKLEDDCFSIGPSGSKICMKIDGQQPDIGNEEGTTQEIPEEYRELLEKDWENMTIEEIMEQFMENESLFKQIE